MDPKTFGQSTAHVNLSTGRIENRAPFRRRQAAGRSARMSPGSCSSIKQRVDHSLHQCTAEPGAERNRKV